MSDSNDELNDFNRNVKWNLMCIGPITANQALEAQSLVESISNFVSELILSGLIYGDRVAFSGKGVCGEIAALLSANFNPGLCVTRNVEITNLLSHFEQEPWKNHAYRKSVLSDTTFCYPDAEKTTIAYNLLESRGCKNQKIRLFRDSEYTVRRVCSFLGYPELDKLCFEKLSDKLDSTRKEVFPKLCLNLNSRPEYVIEQEFDFRLDPYDDRSWRFWFQNLSWLPDYLNSLDKKDAKLAFSVVFRKWMQFVYSKDIDNEFLYHDHSLAYRPIFLIECSRHIPSDIEPIVNEHLVHIAKLLCSPLEDNALSNHSFDQAIALFSLSDYFRDLKISREWRNLAIRRLRRELEYAFTSDGVHVENSPSYHHGMISNLQKSLTSVFNKTQDEFIQKKLDSIRDYVPFLRWITRPDSTLPPIGDSEEKKVYHGLAKRIHPEEYNLEPNGLRVFASGYAIWRYSEPSVYATLKSCFHGRFHRHDDDCSVTLWIDGMNLIVDSGLLFYNEKHPDRIMLRSPRGHSGFEIDTKSPSRDLFDSNSLRSKVEIFDSNTAMASMGMYPEYSAFRRMTYTHEEFVIVDEFGSECIEDGIKINWIIDGRWIPKILDNKVECKDSYGNSWRIEFDGNEVLSISIRESFASEIRNQKKRVHLLQITPKNQTFTTRIHIVSLKNKSVVE